MTKIKICGLREPAHALTAAEAGADFIGMVFAPVRRRVSIEEAQAIVEAVRASGTARPKVVGVFVNAPVAEIHEIAARVGLDMVQLSGDEDEDYLARVRLPMIKAIHVEASLPPEAASTVLRRGLETLRAAGALPLLDAKVQGKFGGTGQAFEWTGVASLAEEYDFLLAGGLESGNVARAIEAVRPWAVDVSSGVETNGVKDAARIRAFIEAVRRRRRQE